MKLQPAPLLPSLLPSLHMLFELCNTSFMKDWQFNPKRTVLAVWEGEVVGFVTSWWDDQPFAWVDILYVHPAYRRMGVGAFLCYAIEALLRNQGVKCIRCVLSEDAEIAAALERAGFTRQGNHLLLEKSYDSEGT